MVVLVVVVDVAVESPDGKAASGACGFEETGETHRSPIFRVEQSMFLWARWGSTAALGWLA